MKHPSMSKVHKRNHYPDHNVIWAQLSPNLITFRPLHDRNLHHGRVIMTCKQNLGSKLNVISLKPHLDCIANLSQCCKLLKRFGARVCDRDLTGLMHYIYTCWSRVQKVMLSHPNIRTGRMPLHVLVLCGSNAVTPKHSHLANWLIEQMTAVLQVKPVGVCMNVIPSCFSKYSRYVIYYLFF